ncbi:MAG TPA: AIR synthase-related protein, partial [Acidimicrobiales bacterium]|nr:AIR synthase-related protein [Acidimicrobiales bacterium]
NRDAASALSALPAAPHAVTDVTGFGLLGHGWEVADRSGAALVLDSASLPLYPGALEAARDGVRTGGDARNRAHLEGKVASSADAPLEALAFDPQTSGGLLAAVPADLAGDASLTDAGFVSVGQVADGPAAVRLV